MALLDWSGMAVQGGSGGRPPAGFEIATSGSSTLTCIPSAGAATSTSNEPSYSAGIINSSNSTSSTGTHRRIGIAVNTPSRFFAGFNYSRTTTSNYVGHIFSIRSGGDIVLWAGEEAANTAADTVIRIGDDTGTEIARVPGLMLEHWKYIEVEVSTTVLRIRVDSVLLVDVAISIPAPDQLVLGASSASINGRNFFDDFYLCDDSGGSYNTFLGPVIIRHIFPDTQLSNTGWTSYTGGSPAISDLTGITSYGGWGRGIATPGSSGNSYEFVFKADGFIESPVAVALLVNTENVGVGDATYDIYLTPDGESESPSPEVSFTHHPGQVIDSETLYSRGGLPISRFQDMVARIVASV